jgi:ParB/Sulfiredoxin domain
MASETYEQTYRIADLSELTEHPENPRQGDVGLIITSIEQNGWYGALEVQKSTGYVISGNHRLKAVRQLGWQRVPIIEKDVDDDTALAILLVDNRSADVASYDDPKLLELLQRFAEEERLIRTGYDGDDLDDLIAAMQENDPDGNVMRDPSIQERLDRYKDSATRSVMLDYPLEEFRWIVDQLGALRERFGAESTAETVRVLVEQATGETFSAA